MKISNQKGIYLNEELGFIPDENELKGKENDKKKKNKNKINGKNKTYKNRNR